MPHKVLFVILTLLSFCAVVEAQNPAEQSEHRLKGPIKTVRVEYRELLYRNDRWVEGDRLLSYIESYALNGEIIKGTRYRRDGSIDYEWTPPANPNERVGFIVCSTCKGKTEFRTTPEYDSKGRVIKEFDKTLDDRLIRWREFKYDDLGKVIEEREFNGTTLMHSELHAYDERGNKKTTQEVDLHGKLGRKWVYQYDENGNLIEQIVYNSDGGVFGKTTFQYDTQGNITEQDHYDNGNFLSSRAEYVYTYDSNGNWVERRTYSTRWLTTAIPPQLIPRAVREIKYRTITYY